jgi:hypothetical protein
LNIGNFNTLKQHQGALHDLAVLLVGNQVVDQPLGTVAAAARGAAAAGGTL